MGILLKKKKRKLSSIVVSFCLELAEVFFWHFIKQLLGIFR